MRKQRTQVEYLLQGREQGIVEFQKELQKMLDEINDRENVATPALAFPTSAGDGRQCVLVQWVMFI
jgi:hypothetical protein